MEEYFDVLYDNLSQEFANTINEYPEIKGQLYISQEKFKEIAELVCPMCQDS